MRNVLDGKLAPGACTRVQWLAKCMRTTTSPLYSFPSFLQTVTFFNPLLLHASPLPSAQTPMPPPTRNATLFPLDQHYLPLSPLFSRHLPEVSAACCLTAALSRLKALSAAPLNSAPEEAQRRAAVLRKAGSACEARVVVRRPSMVSSVNLGD
jgi:hypothetical protein